MHSTPGLIALDDIDVPSDVGEGVLSMAPSVVAPRVVILDPKVASPAHAQRMNYNLRG